MATSSGRDMLLKRYNGTTYVSIGGLRTNALSLNQETVDVTNKDSASHWRELLAGGGVKSAKFSGSGVFVDSAVDALVQNDFWADALVTMQMLVPGFGTFTGSFVIASLEFTGEYNGANVYALTYESAGIITFSPV